MPYLRVLERVLTFTVIGLWPLFFLMGWWFGSIYQNLYLKFTMAKLLDLGIPYCKNLYCRNISMADKEYMKKMFTETFLYFLSIRDGWKQVMACPSWNILQIMKQEVACIYGRMSIMYYRRKMKLQKNNPILVTTNKSQISIHMCMRKDLHEYNWEWGKKHLEL